MEKLEYCIKLKREGFSSEDMKSAMLSKGFSVDEIPYYLEKSEDVFLNHQHSGGSKDKLSKLFKFILLTSFLIILILVFLGYMQVGLIWLLLLGAAVLSHGKFKVKERNRYFK